MTEELRILLLEDVSDDAELIKRELRKGNILPEGTTIRAMIEEGRA